MLLALELVGVVGVVGMVGSGGGWRGRGALGWRWDGRSGRAADVDHPLDAEHQASNETEDAGHVEVEIFMMMLIILLPPPPLLLLMVMIRTGEIVMEVLP